MATANQQAPAQPAQTTTAPAGPQLLDRVIEQTVKAKAAKIESALTHRLEDIENLLPAFMRGQAHRLVARAKQYFARGSAQLHSCTEASFVKCVLEAAELGFAIDGKMVHAVPRSCKLRDANGRELRDEQTSKPVWGYEAQLIPDYKGLISVAKRCGVVQDCWARVVYDTDTFEYEEIDGKVRYHHVPDLSRERDSLAGAKCILAVATHRDGWFRSEIMPTADVLKIRARSSSYKDADSKTPWNTDPGEMGKKTTLKRLLKTFADDPGLIRLMELDDRDYADDPTRQIPAPEAAEPAQSKAERMASALKQHQAPEPDKNNQEETPPPPSLADYQQVLADTTTIDEVRQLVRDAQRDLDEGDIKPFIRDALKHEDQLHPSKTTPPPPDPSAVAKTAAIAKQLGNEFPNGTHGTVTETTPIGGAPTPPPAETPPATLPPASGKFSWTNSTPQERSDYALAQIAVVSQSTNPTQALDSLSKMSKGIKEIDVGEHSFRKIMLAISAAERRFTQDEVNQDPTFPPDDSAEKAAIDALRQLIAAEKPNAARLDQIESHWHEDAVSYSVETLNAGVTIIAKARNNTVA